MQIKIFTFPISDADTEEMNAFLRGHKIVEIRKEIVVYANMAYWTICVTYMPSAINPSFPERKEKVDYKNILEPAVFDRFSVMRTLRKQIAEKDAVPAYSVFIDAELAEFAKAEPLTLSAMQKVQGVGTKRMEKYGELFLQLYTEMCNEKITHEASGIFDRTDSGLG